MLFQDSATRSMSKLLQFHDLVMVVATGVLILTLFWLFATMKNKLSSRFLLEDQNSETLWTLLPMLILLAITLPSLRLLYLLDSPDSPDLTVKVTGNQWFWSYEHHNFPSMEFDSYMITSDELAPGRPRLLEVDNRITLPFNTQIRLLVTASDVLHAWTVPTLGVKADAVPGRLNQLSFSMDRAGVFYGQCSEICGANHSFMPIVVESTSPDHFVQKLNK